MSRGWQIQPSAVGKGATYCLPPPGLSWHPQRQRKKAQQALQRSGALTQASRNSLGAPGWVPRRNRPGWPDQHLATSGPLRMALKPPCPGRAILKGPPPCSHKIKGRGLAGRRSERIYEHFLWTSLTGITPRVQNQREKMTRGGVWTPDSMGLVRWQLPALLPSPEELDLGCDSPQVEHYPNQLQQLSLNQECHVKPKGNSSNHYVQLRIFRAARLPDTGAGKGIHMYM